MRCQQCVHLPQRVAAIAAPPIVRRLVDHACANRVELDLALAGQQIFVGLHQRGFVPAVPERAGASIRFVEVLNVAPPECHDESDHGLARRRREQQMHMIGHQHIRVQRTSASANQWR